MYSSRIITPALAAILSVKLATAETIVIEAGDLYFKPQTVNASVGDILEFHFLPNNHSVVMGDIDIPCQPAATGGFYSGFLPVDNGENANVFQVTINDTNPIVYYCSQAHGKSNHCQGGMIGFVNQGNETAMSTYIALAADDDTNVSPDSEAFGGVLVANANANSTSTTASDTATETTSGATKTATATKSASGKTTETATETGAATSASATGNSGAVVIGSGMFALFMAVMAA